MALTKWIVTLTMVLAALLAVPTRNEVDAGGKKRETSEAKIKATASASKIGADGTQTVTITLAIEKGWHIYANPVGLPEYENNHTLVTVTAKEKLVAAVDYPTGKLDKEKANIYQDRVAIPVRIRRTPGDTSPLQISIQVNACTDWIAGQGGVCLLPGTAKLTVP